MTTYLRALLLLAALLFSTQADATSKFLVLCTTSCTWDNTNDAIWSLSSGGVNNTTHPTSGDTATLDASSCVGGLTCTITVAADLAAQSITFGACTASTTGCILDFSANNNNVTLSAAAGFSGTGTGTRNLKMGNGTWTIQGTSGTPWNMATTTNLTFAAGSSTIAMTGIAGTGGNVTFSGGALTYNAVTFSANIAAVFAGANTFSSLSLTGKLKLTLPANVIQTVTTFSVNGSAANPIGIVSSNASATVPSISVAAGNPTMTWAALSQIGFTGGATFACNPCLDLGNTTGVTITAPTTGTGGGIIGG